MELLGREALAMLLERIELKGTSLPGRFVPTPFMGGSTTRPEENALLDWVQPAGNATVTVPTNLRSAGVQEHKDGSEKISAATK